MVVDLPFHPTSLGQHPLVNVKNFPKIFRFSFAERVNSYFHLLVKNRQLSGSLDCQVVIWAWMLTWEPLTYKTLSFLNKIKKARFSSSVALQREAHTVFDPRAPR